MNNTTVTVGEARLSYVNVFQPYAHNAGQDPKFSVTILIPKTDIKSKAAIDAAIEAAKQLFTFQSGYIPTCGRFAENRTICTLHSNLVIFQRVCNL